MRGVAPAMHWDTSRTFWGQPAADFGHISAAAAKQIGITNEFQTYGLHIDSILAHNNSRYGARKVFAQIRGIDYVPPRVSAPAVDGLAPDTPNVYTDGSMQHPKTKAYRLGGYAVWHPGREKPDQYADQPAQAGFYSEAELD